MDNQTAGIDFGASHSRVMVAWDEKAIQTVAMGQDGMSLTTAAFFGDEAYYGARALDSYLRGARGYFVRDMKEQLSTDIETERDMERRWSISFGNAVRTFLYYLKQHTENTTGQHLNDVVVGRPIHFSSNSVADKKAMITLREFCYQVGFKRVGFQYEPVAAALHYEQSLSSAEVTFIADLGSRSSDFAVVRVSPELAAKTDRTSDILSTGGICLGGTHFDMEVVYRLIMPHFGYEAYRQLSPLAIDRVLSAAEQAKIRLSTAPQVDIKITQPDMHLSVTQDDFLSVTEKTRRSISDAAKATIQKAGLTPDDIQSVVLTGGSSQIPALANSITALCPKAVSRKVDAFTAVGKGLALEAYRRYGRSR